MDKLESAKSYRLNISLKPAAATRPDIKSDKTKNPLQCRGFCIYIKPVPQDQNSKE